MGVKLIALVLSVCSMIIGLWKWWQKRRSLDRLRAKKAREKFEDGVKTDDVSKITSAFDRLKRIRK